MDLRDSRVFVTGASGFTGSWLTRCLLDHGASVTVLLPDWDPEGYFCRSGLFDRVRKVFGSITDFGVLERLFTEHEIDTVFHLAALSLQGRAFRDPRTAFETNARGTWNLLEVCRARAGVVRRVVVASTDKVYGDSEHLPYDEAQALAGRNPYDASKACADIIARSYAHSYGLPLVVGRFANIYGAGDLNWSRLIPGTIRRVLAGEPPVVNVADGGSYRRDFLYVKDLMRAYLALLGAVEQPGCVGRAYNFGTGVGWSVEEVVGRVRALLCPASPEPVFVRTSHEIREQRLSSEAARADLGWAPEYGLDRGLAETVPWYRELLSGEGVADGAGASVLSHEAGSGNGNGAGAWAGTATSRDG